MHALDRDVSALMRIVAAETILPRFKTLAAHEIHEKTPGAAQASSTRRG